MYLSRKILNDLKIYFLSFRISILKRTTVIHAIETRVFLFLEAAPGIINFRATLISRGEGKERAREERKRRRATSVSRGSGNQMAQDTARLFLIRSSPDLHALLHRVGRAYIRNPTNEWTGGGNDAPRCSFHSDRSDRNASFRVGPPTRWRALMHVDHRRLDGPVQDAGGVACD